MKSWIFIALVACCFGLMLYQQTALMSSQRKGNVSQGVGLGKVQRVCKKKPVHQSYYVPNRLYYDDPTKEIYQDNFSKAWSLSTPRREGFDEALLGKGTDALSHDKYLLSLLIFRNNALVFERYFHGAERHHSHNIQSASKSVLSGVMGAAFHDKRFRHRLPKDEGTPILDVFPNSLTRLGKFPQNRHMEVFHLLTMTAGFVWDENKSEKYIQYQKNWAQAILGLPHIKEVGEFFIYSSGAAHLVSALIQKKTGTDACTYAHQALFSKIGIDAEYWGNDPQGLSTGGFNIFMTPREMARFGLLYLNGGKEGGRRILAKEWIDNSLWDHIENVEDETDPRHYHYGYFWWETEIKGLRTFLAWGYRSQFLLLVEELNLLIVSTSDTRDYNKAEKSFDIFKFMERYVIPAIEKGTSDQMKAEADKLGTFVFDYI